MNVLEKILEEIKAIKGKATESGNREDYVTGYICGLSVAEGIIWSYMDKGKDLTILINEGE